MKRLMLLYSNEVVLEDSRVMKLDYSLTERISDEKSPYYGLKVTKYLDGITESEEINGVSEEKDVVVSIIKKLCQFEVTPISTVEIVDELVTQLM